MRGRAAALCCTALLACLTSASPERPRSPLWTAPDPPDDPGWLRIEPGPASVQTLGEPARLRLRGRAASGAHCLWGDEGHGSGRLRIASPERPGVVEVRCRSGMQRASAQVTFTDAALRVGTHPYAGALALIKLRRAPRGDPLCSHT